MAWSVVTIESAVNHMIAEHVSNKMLATIAIEYPKQVIQKLQIKTFSKSDLAAKLIILNDCSSDSEDILQLADSLALVRSDVVHDKPFDLTDRGEGDVEVEYFRARGTDPKSYKYEDLSDFFEKCDQVMGCVRGMGKDVPADFAVLQFRSLLKCPQGS